MGRGMHSYHLDTIQWLLNHAGTFNMTEVNHHAKMVASTMPVLVSYSQQSKLPTQCYQPAAVRSHLAKGPGHILRP